METVARQSILSHDLTVSPGSFSNKEPTHTRTQMVHSVVSAPSGAKGVVVLFFCSHQYCEKTTQH